MPDKSHPTPFPTTRIYEKLANILPRPQKNSAIRLYNDVLPQQRLLIETLLHTPPHRSIRTYHREQTNVRRPCRAQPPLSSTLKQPPRPRLDPAPPGAIYSFFIFLFIYPLRLFFNRIVFKPFFHKYSFFFSHFQY